MTTNCSYFNPISVGSSTEQFAFASSSCQSVAGADDTNYFSGGDIVVSVLLFMIFLSVVFSFLTFRFLGVKIHKQQ